MSSEPCFICLEDCQGIVAGPCQHGMCPDCAVSWLSQKQECAYCRQPLRLEDLKGIGPLSALGCDEILVARESSDSSNREVSPTGSPTASPTDNPNDSPTITFTDSPSGPFPWRQGSLPDIRWVTPMPPRPVRRSSDMPMMPRPATSTNVAQSQGMGLSRMTSSRSCDISLLPRPATSANLAQSQALVLSQRSVPSRGSTTTRPQPARRTSSPIRSASQPDDSLDALQRSCSLPNFSDSPPSFPTPPVIRRTGHLQNSRIDAPTMPTPATRQTNLQRVTPPMALQSRMQPRRAAQPLMMGDMPEGSGRPPIMTPTSGESPEPAVLDPSLVRPNTPTGALLLPRPATPPSKTPRAALAPSRQAAPFRGATASWPQSVRSVSPSLIPTTSPLPHRTGNAPFQRGEMPKGTRPAVQTPSA